jgi:hypothetical protein
MVLPQVLGLKLPLKRRDPHYFLPTTGRNTRVEHASNRVFFPTPQQQQQQQGKAHGTHISLWGHQVA